MVERFRAVRQFFHEEGELVTYEDYKALADKLQDAEKRIDNLCGALESSGKGHAAKDAHARELESRLPRWRIRAYEKPTEDGEYIVGRHAELFGGWQLGFDHFEVESGEWASDDDGPRVVVWMPCPAFPDVRCGNANCNVLISSGEQHVEGCLAGVVENRDLKEQVCEHNKTGDCGYCASPE